MAERTQFLSSNCRSILKSFNMLSSFSFEPSNSVEAWNGGCLHLFSRMGNN